MKLAIWIIECKTFGCHGHQTAKVIGEHEGHKEYVLPAGIPELFDFQCPTCGNTHRYTLGDLKVKIVHFQPSPGLREWW